MQAVDPETLFDKQERIGRGSFGEVYKGVDKITGDTVSWLNYLID